MKNTVFLSLFLFFTLITSCTSNRWTLLDDTSCEPPCWINIIPGISTKEDVLQILNDSENINQSSIEEYHPTIQEYQSNRNYWETSLQWSFDNEKKTSGWIDFHENEVVLIESNYFQNIKLSDIIKKYGIPDEVYSMTGVLESVILYFNLVYTDGICVELDTRRIQKTPIDSVHGPFNVDIEPKIRVKSITYFDSTLSSAEINNSCFWPVEENNKQIWTGYGNYIVLPEEF